VQPSQALGTEPTVATGPDLEQTRGRGKQSGSQAPRPRNRSVSPCRGPLRCEIKAAINSLPRGHLSLLPDTKVEGRWQGCWVMGPAALGTLGLPRGPAPEPHAEQREEDPAGCIFNPSSRFHPPPSAPTQPGGDTAATYHPRTAPAWPPPGSSAAGRRPPAARTGCRR